MEKVYQMAADEAYDFIVVDTPPAQQALDFLDTPQRMIDFLDSRLVSGLIHPAFAAGRFGFKVFQGGAKRVLHLIERVSGVGFIEDISEFLLAFEGMSDGFRDRASRVKELLLGPESSFVLVTGPAHESVDQALLFLDRLEAYEVPLAGVVANRVREWPEGSPPRNLDSDGGDVGALAHALSLTAAGSQAEDAARAAVAAAAGYAGWVHRDAEALEPVREHAGIDGRFFRQIPELPQDVHDLDSLDRIAHYLFHRN
jgi:anion-transporting  ArsA/GET3 family ATPase